MKSSYINCQVVIFPGPNEFTDVTQEEKSDWTQKQSVVCLGEKCYTSTWDQTYHTDHMLWLISRRKKRSLSLPFSSLRELISINH